MIALESGLGLEIAVAEQRRQDALVSGDPAALEAVLHPDLLHIHSRGNAQNKAEFMEHLRKMGGFVSIERGPYNLCAAGDAVILSGATLNTVRRLESGEIASLHGFNTVVYARGEEGDWQVILSQMTPFSTS